MRGSGPGRNRKTKCRKRLYFIPSAMVGQFNQPGPTHVNSDTAQASATIALPNWVRLALSTFPPASGVVW